MTSSPLLQVVLATGIQGGGEWHVPGMIQDSCPRHLYAHTSEDIDFEKLKVCQGQGALTWPKLDHLVLNPRLWTPDPGPQTLDPRPWTPDPGPQTLGPRPWTPDPGPQTLDPPPPDLAPCLCPPPPQGKRVAILGGGASAFDNARWGLERGVGEVHVFIRRNDLPRINPIRFMEFAGTRMLRMVVVVLMNDDADDGTWMLASDTITTAIC